MIFIYDKKKKKKKKKEELLLIYLHFEKLNIIGLFLNVE
jgi:hypothetical protein